MVDDDEAFTKKKVGAAALDESDGRRSASEAGRAPAQRPWRDRGIAAKQCRSSQPLNRLGQIRGGELWARPGPRGHRAGARQARVLTGCQHEIRELRTYRRACVYSLKGLKMRNRSLSRREYSQKSGIFFARVRPCWVCTHLKFESPRCFYCRDRAPRPWFPIHRREG